METDGKINILIVDDHPENLDALEVSLRGVNARLVRADSGEAALRAVLQQEFAVILLDVQMPQMDGFETAALIRQRERSAHTPIIFLTAIERSEERVFEGYQSGAVDYIFKPFNPDILRAKVGVFVDLFNMRSALARSEASLRHINATLEDMVTQRTHELVKAEAKYRQLVENIHEIFLMGKVEADFTQGAITFISPQVESILGIPAADFVKDAAAWVRHTHPEDKAALTAITRKALSEGKPVTRAYRQENARTDEYCWLEDTLLPQFDEGGRVIGYYGVARDITERRRAEDAIRESEERFSMFMDNSPAVAWMKDAEDWTFRYINRQFERVFNLTREEINLKTDFDLWPENVAQTLRQNDLAVLASGEAIQIFEDVPLADGRVRNWLVFKFPPKLVSGKQYVAGTAIDITERKQAEEQINRQLHNIQSLRTIDQAITSSFDLRLTLNIFLEQATSRLGMDAASVLLLKETNSLVYAAGRGFRTDAVPTSQARLGVGNAGRAALERVLVKAEDLGSEKGRFAREKLVKDEGFASYFAMPLAAKGNLLGVLELYHRTAFTPDADWLEFLETLAGQAAIAVDNASLFADLQHSNMELFDAYDATIEGWSHALDLRDKETENHTQRVAEMTVRLARAAGMTEAELVHVRRGALLHDIGKMGVPDHILLKPGELTDEEWVAMRKHPTFAFELLTPISYLRPALDIPYCHHEKWDGTGYPRGLKGETIPLAARIFAVADVYDALTSDRPYRPAWTKEKTLEHIRAGAGSHFDPAAAQMFIKMMMNRA